MKYMVVPFYGSSDKHPDYAFVRFTAATRERVRALPEVHCVRGGAVFLPLCAYEVDLVWVDHEPLAEFVKGFVNSDAWAVLSERPSIEVADVVRKQPYAVTLRRDEEGKLALLVKPGVNSAPLESFSASRVMVARAPFLFKV